MDVYCWICHRKYDQLRSEELVAIGHGNVPLAIMPYWMTSTLYNAIL